MMCHCLTVLLQPSVETAVCSRVGLIESKIRILIGSLERNAEIKLAHVNPKAFEPVRETCVFFL